MSAYHWGFVGGTVFGIVVGLCLARIGGLLWTLFDKSESPLFTNKDFAGISDEQIRALEADIRAARGIKGRKLEH